MEYDSKLTNAEMREKTIIRLVDCGTPLNDVINILRKLYIADQEDFDEEFITREVFSYHEKCLMAAHEPKKSVQSLIWDWITSNGSNGPRYNLVTISLQSCYNDLNLKSVADRAACRMAFKRFVEWGKLEPVRNRSGIYRYIDGQMEELDFMNADTTPFGVKFPLGVHELVVTYQKSLIVLAGEPDSGKTAYCLNTAWKNKDEYPVTYFSSEGGAAELKIRLGKFNYNLADWKKIRFISKTADFKDVVEPNGFNIIDYLEVSKDFYEIGGMLTDIYNALDKGIVIVAIQKPIGRDVGVGGERTLDKARLYLSIAPGVLKIVKAKLWRQDCINPKGMSIKWTLGGGANFKVIPDNDGSEWRRP
jgi:hypothetical protein